MIHSRVPQNCPRLFNLIMFDPDKDNVFCFHNKALPAGFTLTQTTIKDKVIALLLPHILHVFTPEFTIPLPHSHNNQCVFGLWPSLCICSACACIPVCSVVICTAHMRHTDCSVNEV